MIMLQQMIVLLLLMLLGVIARRVKIIDENNMKQLSSMVVNIANPAMIISGCLNRVDKITRQNIMITIITAISIFAFLILISKIVVIVLKIGYENRPIYRLQMIFSNIGFMGLPIILSVYGNKALIYMTLFLIIYNILIYTYGIRVVAGHMTEVIKENGSFKVILKNIMNTGVIACIISVIIYFMDINLPYILVKTIQMISDTAAPLSMMIIGATLVDIKLKELMTDYKMILFSLIKLLVVPVGFMLIIKMFIGNMELLGVCMVVLATPAGSITAMLAQQYDTNSELASKGVAFTTFLSVVTLPIVSVLVF